jgi:effector-binding domain-containing protein
VAEDVVVREVEDLPVLAVHKQVSMATIGPAIGEAMGALGAHLEASGAACTGPPFCLYPDEMGDEFGVVVCMPVPEGTRGAGEVGYEVVPGGTCASTLHRGPYSSIGAAYGALQAWMAGHGKHPAGPPREAYLNDPTAVPAEELLTQIDWPVA